MSIDWLQADWPAPANVRLISTLRSGGVSRGPFESLNLGDHIGDTAACVAENRRRLVCDADLPAEPCWLKQVHGVAVRRVDDLAEAAADADAATTTQVRRVCAILSADCLPVMFAADSGDVVAAAHAGWRGLAAGVLEATVQAMRIPAERLLVWLGPCIGPEHFEVGAEVRQAFLDRDEGAEEAFLPNSRGRYMADLSHLARRRLIALGAERIYGGGRCTFSRPDLYFSHRRDGVSGRHATLIWLSSR